MSKDDGEIRCQVLWQLNEDKKYDEVVVHVLSGCLHCITNPRKRFNGREMLFPNGPPPWIKIPEAEKTNPTAWKNYHKKQVTVQMTPEEHEKFLINSDISDSAMAFEIAKYTRKEKTQCWKYVHEIRRKQKAKWMEEEKKNREIKKKELEAKREAEKVKKMDEKRKILEKKQLKDEEKQEYLDKMKEEEKLLEEALGSDSDENPAEDSETSEAKFTRNPFHLESVSNKKEFNLKKQMPWSPSTYDILCSESRSILDHGHQKRLIAMCSSMMYHGALRHTGNKHELKDIRKATESEYETLVAAALEHARSEACHPIDFSVERIMSYCMAQFKYREPTGNPHFLSKSPSFTVEDIEVAGGIRSEHQAILPVMEKLVKSATWIQQLTIPDITKKCEVMQNLKRPPSKSRLLQDSIAESLLSICPQVTVIADATTVSHLLTPNWETRDYEFAIPILIKEERINGETRKVVILSKPMPSNMVSRASLQRKALKRFLKNQFLKRNILNPSQKSTFQKPRNPVTSSEESEKPLKLSQESPEASEQESSQPTSSASGTNFLDDLLAEMEQSDKKFGGKSGKSDENSIKNLEFQPKNSQDLNYQYAVFRIGDARILIRSSAPHTFEELGEKKHSIIENLKKISFEPRIEFLPNGGAMELGKEEWIWNYTKAIFKMSESHVLYRTLYRLDHVLQVDALTMRIDLQEPPPDALGILSARTMMLEAMIGQLESLEPGEYLAIQEKNHPLIVVPKCDPEQRGGVSIEAMRIKKSDCQKIFETIQDDYFHGFCRDIALQWQIVQGRAPQMLLAQDSPMTNFMPSKNNRDKLQRQKSNFKRKFQYREAEKEESKRQKTIDLDDPNLYADFTNPSVVPMDFRPCYDKKPNRGRGGGRGRGFNRGGFRGGRGFQRGRGGEGRGRGRGGRGGQITEGSENVGDSEGPSTSQFPPIP